MKPVPATLPVATPFPPPRLGERYVVRGELGAGGTAIVLRTHDLRLDVDVALKVLRPDLPEWTDRFRAEARLHARLRHPGIPPVHDLGTLEDGRPFYTMAIVDGTTLARLARPPPGRAVELVRRVAEILAYAHSVAVVHGDLSPHNVVVGPLGAVTVVDWGLAFHVGAHRAHGIGTPGFSVDRADPTADVYALGGLLGWLLGEGPDSPRSIPDDSLRDTAEACRRMDLPDAGAVFAALTAWTEGAARREKALARMEDATEAQVNAQRALAEADALRRAAAAHLDPLPRWAPEAEKAAGWALLAEARRVEARAVLEAARAESALRAAIETAPELEAAQAALAEHWLTELDAAESRGDTRDAVRLQGLVRGHAGGRWAGRLDAPVSLTVSVPPGRTVQLEREERPLGRSVWEALGEGRAWTLPPGTYRVVVDGRLRAPVLLARGRATHLALALHDLGPDEILIPGGPFARGGDPLAADALPGARVDVRSFVIRRDPLTWREYLPFAAAHPEHAPLEAGGLHARPRPLVGMGPDGPCVLPDAAGRVADLDEPVTQVDWHDATAFARWESARTGLPWRLPHDHEWEKAARGVDGRAFPWGDAFDPTWCNMAESRPGTPSATSVDAFPEDESPYGVRGMAGNVREWCANTYSRVGPPPGPLDLSPGIGPLRMVRGGAWSSAPWLCRAAVRLASDERIRLPSVGFRLVRSV